MLDTMDTVPSLYVGVAWSRAKVSLPLQQFDLRLVDDDQLQLVGMHYSDTLFSCACRVQGSNTPISILPDGPKKML